MREKREELKKLNEDNLHLSRALQPVKLKDGSYALSDDILRDEGTWANWMSFVSDLPQREVLDDELMAPEDLL